MTEPADYDHLISFQFKISKNHNFFEEGGANFEGNKVIKLPKKDDSNEKIIRQHCVRKIIL